MPNVTNADDARYQLESYFDDAVTSLEAAEKTLSDINFSDDSISTIQSEVDNALSEINEALKTLRG